MCPAACLACSPAMFAHWHRGETPSQAASTPDIVECAAHVDQNPRYCTVVQRVGCMYRRSMSLAYSSGPRNSHIPVRHANVPRGEAWAFAGLRKRPCHAFVFPSALGLCLSERSPVTPVCWRVTSQRSSDTFHLPTTSITDQPQFF